MQNHDLEEILHIVTTFFAIFSNKNGKVPNLLELYELFIKQGTITKVENQSSEVYQLGEFVEPRQKLLTDGRLLDFEEFEIGERTTIHGDLAMRLSCYQKSGKLQGAHFDTKGIKMFQLVRTHLGWRFASIVWQDECQDFIVPVVPQLPHDRMRHAK
jgi:hypothetical protein